MRRRFAVLALGLALALAAPAASQQDGRAWGFGVGIGNSPGLPTAGLTGFPVFYVPIALRDDLLLEPSFGLIHYDYDESDVSATALRLGTGLLFLHDVGPDGRTYVGPRAGLLFSSSDNGVVDQDETDVYIAGVVGGEFFLVDSFSLGGEAGLGYASTDPSVLNTLATLRVRWYMR